MPDVSSVLSEKYKGMEWSLNGSPTNEAEFKAGFTIHKANGVEKPTWSAIQTELKKMQDEYDAQAYARARAEAYPSWEKQLEKIYDDGVDKWKSEMVDPVKAKYPKPE